MKQNQWKEKQKYSQGAKIMNLMLKAIKPHGMFKPHGMLKAIPPHGISIAKVPV